MFTSPIIGVIDLNVSVEVSEARGVLQDSYSDQNDTFLDKDPTSEEGIGHQGMA